MKCSHVLVLTFLCSIVFSGCGDKKSTKDNEKATVTISALRQGQPVDSALVTISPSSSPNTLSAVGTTGLDGKCILSGLQGGNFVVNVSKSVEGQLIYGTKSNLQISTGANVCSVGVNQQADDFCPVALGNWWTLSNGEDSTLTIGIYAIKMVRGVLTYTFGPDSGGYPGYVTRGVTALYLHGGASNSGGDWILHPPVVWMDFAGSVNSTWNVPNWGSVELVEKDVTVIAPASSFSGCLHFKFYADVAVREIWFAPGVGPAQMLDRDSVTWQIIDYELH
jgi:hypothetical protein